MYRLHKALYGLKQAPRTWNARIDSFLQSQGFQKSLNDATLYVLKGGNGVSLIVSLYVDDILITGAYCHEVEKFKADLQKEFDMSDLGLMRYFLGLEVSQNRNGIHLT